MPATCWDCGETGHVVADCPNAAFTGTSDGKPPWCGACDERTRMFGLDVAHRCPVCNPNRRQSLKQHRKCPSCHQTAHEWDNAPCGSHSGPDAKDRRPDRDHIEQIVAAT